MFVLNEDFLPVFKQVLKYIEKHYTPEENTMYTDKFEMLSDLKPIDKNAIWEEHFIDFMKVDWDEKLKKIKEKKNEENIFCENIITYLDNNLEQLKICCNKSHLTETAFKKICNKTFSPTKPCVFNLIIAAKLNFEQATELLKSANISIYQSNKFDVVMSFFFENRIYDFSTINTTLYLLDLPMLGYYYV